MPNPAQLRLELLLEHSSRSRSIAVGGSAGQRSAASHVLGRLGHVDGVLRCLVDSPERAVTAGFRLIVAQMVLNWPTRMTPPKARRRFSSR